MGSSLKEQVALSEKLLDFEGGIEEELVAATFVSGQFNLSKARALAIEGETALAAEETLRQIQRSGDFRKQDYHTQMALAKASGMTVEEINKQLNAQDKLSSLTEEQKIAAEEAIKAGLDITDIKAEDLALETQKFAAQQEQQATLEKIQNQFMGIVATVGSQLVPILETIAPILIMAFKPIGVAAKFLGDMI
jgi:formate-dependent nitrite reductase cytochrome c552 subunit